MNKVGLIYGPSGAGKTVNSSRASAEGGKKVCLLSSDYSYVALNNFPDIRKNVDVVEIYHWLDKDKKGLAQENFIKQFSDAVNSGKYSTIIVDNLTNLFDMAILEYDETGNFNDPRRYYLLVYQQLKRLLIKANQVNCNVLFTAWELVDSVPDKDGTLYERVRPHLPLKIMDSILGLCQIVGKVRKDDKKGYYYDLRGSEFRYGKDQIYAREYCLPENIFNNKEEKK